MYKLSCKFIVIIFFGMASYSFSQIQYPTDSDIQGIKNVCGGGDVQSVNLKIDAALKKWRLDVGANASLDAAKKNLGAVLEKVTANEAGEKLYSSYVGCVQNLIGKYMEHNIKSEKTENCRPYEKNVRTKTRENMRGSHDGMYGPPPFERPISCSKMNALAKEDLKARCSEEYQGIIIASEQGECECVGDEDSPPVDCNVYVYGKCEYYSSETVLVNPCSESPAE